MNKLNNKGFTLVELLAVLVIMVAIMGIAIPSISSSMERSKEKQNEQRKELLISAAELYASEHRSVALRCISLIDLRDSGYVDESALNDADGNFFGGSITKNGSSWEYQRGLCS